MASAASSSFTVALPVLIARSVFAAWSIIFSLAFNLASSSLNSEPFAFAISFCSSIRRSYAALFSSFSSSMRSSSSLEYSLVSLLPYFCSRTVSIQSARLNCPSICSSSSGCTSSVILSVFVTGSGLNACVSSSRISLKFFASSA